MTPEPNKRDQRPYVVIAGHGRSGSNRLLDALDCHATTYCRNEPNELDGAPFEQLGVGFFPIENNQDLFLQNWREAIARAAMEMGDRDRIGARHKAYLQKSLLPVTKALLSRRGVRKRLPGIKAETWTAPDWYASAPKLRQALPVFKLLLCQGWLMSAFDQEPGMLIVHNIRRPDAFLRSWWRRYATVIGPERVFHDNLANIDQILEFFGAPRGQFNIFSEEALIRSELWRWRYVNESLYNALKGSPRYHLTTYEAYDGNPIEEVRRLCAFCGLDFDKDMEKRVTALKNTLFADKKSSPANNAETFIRDNVERVTGDSSLGDLWNSNR